MDQRVSTKLRNWNKKNISPWWGDRERFRHQVEKLSGARVVMRELLWLWWGAQKSTILIPDARFVGGHARAGSIYSFVDWRSNEIGRCGFWSRLIIDWRSLGCINFDFEMQGSGLKIWGKGKVKKEGELKKVAGLGFIFGFLSIILFNSADNDKYCWVKWKTPTCTRTLWTFKLYTSPYFIYFLLFWTEVLLAKLLPRF